MYQATDQPAGLQIYACTAANTWTRVAYSQGSSNSGTCSVGQIFFNTSASAGSNLYLCTATNAWTQVTGGGGPIFSSLHSGFTAYTNPESSITGTVPYTDYSGQATTGPYQGPGLATFTEPVSMNRTVISITSGFQATGGTPAITALQLSVGTLTNPTAYMLPVQVGYQLASGTACAVGVGSFVLSAPILPANQTATVVVSGANPFNYNGTFTATWTSSTTFTAPMTCASWISGGMAGLQGLIAGNFAALPQAMSGTNTAYLWLTETNTSPAAFTTLTAGAVKVMLGGVQLQ